MEIKLRRDVAFITSVLIVSIVMLPEFEGLAKFLAIVFIQLILYFWTTNRSDD